MAFDYKKEYKEFYLPKNHPEIVEIPEMNFIAVRGKGDPNVEGGAYKEAIGLLYGIAFTIKMSKKGSHRIDGYFDFVVPPLEGFWRQENTMQARTAQSSVTQVSRPQAGMTQCGGTQERAGQAGMTQCGSTQERVVQAGMTQWGSAQECMVQAGMTQCGSAQERAGQADGRPQGDWEIDYSRKQDFCWTSVIRLPDFVTEEEFCWAVAEAERTKRQDFSRVEFLTVREGLCVQCMHVGPYDAEPATVARMDQFLLENGYENDFSAERMHHEIYLSDPRRVAPERQKTVIRHPIKRLE